jgi:hypothetical protein
LLTAEPHATADRVHQLEQQARRDTRQSPAYTDVTLSFSKSISLLHGSIRESAARARDRGDLRTPGGTNETSGFARSSRRRTPQQWLASRRGRA